MKETHEKGNRIIVLDSPDEAVRVVSAASVIVQADGDFESVHMQGSNDGVNWYNIPDTLLRSPGIVALPYIPLNIRAQGDAQITILVRV